jgi:hypothetical protein
MDVEQSPLIGSGRFPRNKWFRKAQNLRFSPLQNQSVEAAFPETFLESSGS